MAEFSQASLNLPDCAARKYDSSKYKSRSNGIKIDYNIAETNPILVVPANSEVIDYYYIDINLMNQKQLDYFKKYAKFEKMTPKDYINWLHLNKDNLKGYHKSMWYTHFVLGYPIIKEDIPKSKELGAIFNNKDSKKNEQIRIDNSILDIMSGLYN